MEEEKNSHRENGERTYLKGRGALSNPDNRFSPHTTEDFDDGWDISEPPPPSPATSVIRERAKTIISTNKSPDIPFDQSINPYRGCEHGCIYCYARPTHAYWDLSPGLDFETKIIAKPNAAELLREKFSRPDYKPTTICIGANTDPYQPQESGLQITRSILEVLEEFRHPFSVITKSSLVLRDLDILEPMARDRLCSVAVSVTTLDNSLKRILEPRTPSGRVRLKSIGGLARAGVPVSLLAAPMIPYINDHELESILEAGKDQGARSARYILLRLPLEISDMFQEWLQTHFPDRAAKVMSIVRQSRGGRNYRSAFGERMRGTGHFADLLNNRWQISSRKLGFLNSDTNSDNDRFQLDNTQFRATNKQMTLF